MAGPLWAGVGGDASELSRLQLSGGDPLLPSLFPLGAAAAACVGTATLAAAGYGGGRGAVRVDAREAVTAFASERLLRIDGRPPPDPWAALSGDYRTADGWVRLHCNFLHHRDAAVRAVGLPVPAEGETTRRALEAAVAPARAVEVEEAVVAAGGCAGAYRSSAQWRAHPQQQALARIPLVRITRLGDADPPRAGPGAAEGAGGHGALGGLRVLDLTRVIAGPVCGRVLASHGADVLHVGAAHLPVIPALVVDTGFGKRSCLLDLRRPDDHRTLDELAGQADVFLQGYRPGALEGRGFGPEELAARHRGLVIVNVSAYGGVGPWGARRGFDSLVQMVTGLVHAQAEAAGVERPMSLPVQALDHATGWLAALGAIAALRRRQLEGGSWAVDVALARTAAWLDALGRVEGGLDTPTPSAGELADLLAETDSPFGRLRHVRAVGRLVDHPVGWSTPPVPPGTHPAAFPERTS